MAEKTNSWAGALWAWIKKDVSILVVGAGFLLGVFHAGERLKSIESDLAQMKAENASIRVMMEKHDRKLDEDSEILNILCFQFRCRASDPPRSTPSPYSREDMMGYADPPPKPHSRIDPFAGMIYQSKATIPPENTQLQGGSPWQMTSSQNPYR
jgi:hypothetical protein